MNHQELVYMLTPWLYIQTRVDLSFNLDLNDIKWIHL